MARIVSAFPGTGKSYYFNQHEATGLVLDSDSSLFSWVQLDGEKIRNPDFPDNYMAHIGKNLGKLGANGLILVSSHEDVRDALVDHGHAFTLIYPEFNLREEYLQRYKDRGSPEGFLKLVNANWELWLEQLAAQEGATHVALGSGQFISDVLEPPK